MSLFDDIFKGVQGSMGKEEAFFAVLAVAMFIDGKVAPEEQEELAALAHRTKTLKQIGDDQIRKWLGDWRDDLEDKTKIKNLIANAVSSLSREPKEMRMSVFLHACDIVFADRVINVQEQEYLRDLIKKFELDENEAAVNMRALKIKNDF
jgi:tellurite resistance protein